MSLEAATHRVFPVPRPGFPAAAASGDEGKKARPFSSGRVETGKLNRPDFDLHAPILTREAWRNLNDEECAAAPKRRGDPFLAAQRYSTVRSTISLLHFIGKAGAKALARNYTASNEPDTAKRWSQTPVCELPKIA